MISFVFIKKWIKNCNVLGAMIKNTPFLYEMDFKILATMTYYMHMHPCKTSYKYVSRNCVKSKLYFCRKLQIFVEESFFLNSIERNLISKYKRLFLNIMRTPPCASPFTWESFTLHVEGLLPSILYIQYYDVDLMPILKPVTLKVHFL